MQCPFCVEEIRENASICQYCRNDLRIPDALLTENQDLKKHVVELRRELGELRGKAASDNEPPP
jgi:hypothetical protein